LREALVAADQEYKKHLGQVRAALPESCLAHLVAAHGASTAAFAAEGETGREGRSMAAHSCVAPFWLSVSGSSSRLSLLSITVALASDH
jgi:hypothetical protein